MSTFFRRSRGSCLLEKNPDATAPMPVFVGSTKRGPAFIPSRIQALDEFEKAFGEFLHDDYLSFSLSHFFASRGNACWLISTGQEPIRGKTALLSSSLPPFVFVRRRQIETPRIEFDASACAFTVSVRRRVVPHGFRLSA